MAIPKKPVVKKKSMRYYVDKLLDKFTRAEEFARKIPTLPKKDLVVLTGKFAVGFTLFGCLCLYNWKGGIRDYFFSERELRDARLLELHGIKAITKNNPGTEQPFNTYGWDFRDRINKKSESE